MRPKILFTTNVPLDDLRWAGEEDGEGSDFLCLSVPDGDGEPTDSPWLGGNSEFSEAPATFPPSLLTADEADNDRCGLVPPV